MGGTPQTPQRLTFEFYALCLILLSAFGNVCVFYSFYHYLGTIGIPVVWRGFLVGLEPMAAFVLRLFVLPWLHLRNAYSVLVASLVLLILASCSYPWVTTVPPMIVLRIVHGTAFVLLTSALIALVVNFIPKDLSGRGFSTVSIATMIPYAVIPPLAEAILPCVRNEADIYAGVSIFSVAALALLAAMGKRVGKAIRGMDSVLLRRPTLAEIRENLRLRAVVVLLSASLLVYLAHAAVFYFLKDLTLKTGGGDVGLFFMFSMLTMIAVRALGTALFDKMDKPIAFRAGLGLLLPCLIAIPHAGSPAAYYLLALLYGFCMGIVLPLLNALLFSASPPALRGLNTNLGLFTLDLAYFLLPYLGGTVLAFGAGFDLLFYGGAGFALLSLALSVSLKGTSGGQREKRPSERSGTHEER
ncbi:MAG: Major Facilitator Superfamily protein [Syntrophaceae bacterium PtaU1.Bin231]|nr:MAG: Major Facilitator Superfamily protein [Syntrophaceae bacterium PtaU1.Bin231]